MTMKQILNGKFIVILLFLNLPIYLFGQKNVNDSVDDRQLTEYIWKKKINYWQTVFPEFNTDSGKSAIKQKERTLLPKADYIDYILLKNFILPTPDSRHFLEATNKDLANMELIPVNFPFKIPDLPKLDSSESEQFSYKLKQQSLPSAALITQYYRYEAQINSFFSKKSWNDTEWGLYNKLLYNLNTLTLIIDRLDAESCKIINNYLEEISQIINADNGQEWQKDSKLSNMINNFYQFTFPLRFSTRTANHKQPTIFSNASYAQGKLQNILNYKRKLPDEMPQLVRFDFIVYRKVNGKIIIDTEELRGKYDIFIVSNGLFKPTNPKWNTEVIKFVSVIPYLLPNAVFKCWAEHKGQKVSEYKAIDTLEAYLHSKGTLPNIKNYSILIEIN
jgi:hypothetical protein